MKDAVINTVKDAMKVCEHPNSALSMQVVGEYSFNVTDDSTVELEHENAAVEEVTDISCHRCGVDRLQESGFSLSETRTIVRPDDNSVEMEVFDETVVMVKDDNGQRKYIISVGDFGGWDISMQGDRGGCFVVNGADSKSHAIALIPSVHKDVVSGLYDEEINSY